jgi:hypothetical protein
MISKGFDASMSVGRTHRRPFRRVVNERARTGVSIKESI